jgi:chromosome segregation ATPase
MTNPKLEGEIMLGIGVSGSVRPMADDSSGEGLRSRLAKSSEDAVGKLAQDLLENRLINSAITRAFDARHKAVQAQEVAMGALNLPSAADIERLTRRVRAVSQRLEGIEDGVDRVDERLGGLDRATALEERLDAIEEQLRAIAAVLATLSEQTSAAPEPRHSNAGEAAASTPE